MSNVDPVLVADAAADDDASAMVHDDDGDDDGVVVGDDDQPGLTFGRRERSILMPVHFLLLVGRVVHSNCDD